MKAKKKFKCQLNGAALTNRCIEYSYFVRAFSTYLTIISKLDIKIKTVDKGPLKK